MDFVRAFHEKIRDLQVIPPLTVKQGPVAENVMEGDQIDLYKFPSPFHHEKDGGRYFGTAHVVLTQHPDEGWYNLGTYRCMVHSKDTLGLHITGGKHGRIHRDLYFERGQPMKVVVAAGVDPALYLAAASEIPWRVSEYGYAGALKGGPIAVMTGPSSLINPRATAEPSTPWAPNFARA